MFRSARHIYAQVIDDSTGATLAHASTLSKDLKGTLEEDNKTAAAKKVGVLIAKICKSKKIALEKMFNLRALRYMTPFLMRDIDEIYEIFDGDPWPYGVEPNRKTLEALVTFLKDQHLIAEAPKVDDLFVPTYGEPDSWY